MVGAWKIDTNSCLNLDLNPIMSTGMTTSEATQKITDYVVENFRYDDLAKGSTKETNPYLTTGKSFVSVQAVLPL